MNPAAEFKPTKLYDASKLTDFMLRGARFYYLKHILGWRRDEEQVSYPLATGTAWHTTMDWLYTSACGRKDMGFLLDSYHRVVWDKFDTAWVDEGMPSEPFDDDTAAALKQRHPWVFHGMLQEYIKQRAEWFATVELLATEWAFCVPIFENDPEVGVIGLIDKVLRFNAIHNKPVRPLDHKTTTRYSTVSGIQPLWLTQQAAGLQMPIYSYATQLAYDDADGWAVLDASLIHKTSPKDPAKVKSVQDVHKLYPVNFPTPLLDAKLEVARRMIRRIQHEESEFAKGNPAWLPECGGCSTFTVCQFSDICSTCPDVREIVKPHDFNVDFWRPVEVAK